MKSKILLYGMSTAVMLLSAACHKEIYDPEALSRDYFIQDIPQNFDWSTTSTSTLTVIPEDRYDSRYNYTIEVFGENPLLNEAAPLYAIGWATAQIPFCKDITIPEADSLLYIRQTSPGGRKCVKIIQVNSREMNCDFRNSTAVKSRNSVFTTKASSIEMPQNVPGNAVEISGNKNQNLSPNTNYVIRGTFNHKLTFPGEGKCNLYITGTWNVPSYEISLSNNCNIYILKNGKLLPHESLKIVFHTANQMLGIAQGGQLGTEDQDDIELLFYNTTCLINEGEFYGDDIKMQQEGSQIINRGKFYLDDLSNSNNSFYFHNECYVKMDEADFSNGTLYIGPHCAFVCKEMDLLKSYITLESGAMLKVKELETQWIDKASSIKGIGSQPALVDIKELDVKEGQKPLQFHDNLHIAISEKPKNEKAYTADNSCVMEDATSGPSLEIKPSECSEGNDYTPEEPEKPEFPKLVTYNQCYTYASEDNFPNPGDYDMNDLVISLDSFSHQYQSEGKVNQLIWHLTLRAVGATRQLGAAIQIDRMLPAEIKSVSYSKNISREIFRVNGNGTERQDSTVIPLFDNGHKVFGYPNSSAMINTRTLSSDKVAVYSFDVTIEFNSPVTDSKIGIDKFNYFTIVGNKPDNRVEIHQPHYNHSALSNTPAKQQVVTKELMWTIKVPGLFRYPEEWNGIKKAYPQFEAWVQSDGKSFTDWYRHAENSHLYKE